MSDIKLYGYATSPFVRKVAACLYYKNLPFEHIPVNPIDPEKTIGFTGGTQVPVLTVGEDWKADSTPIAIWLDDLYPDRPLLPVEPVQREAILEIDEWLNNSFYPGFFRIALDGRKDLNFKFRGWRLAALVSAQTPLPEKIRHMWPDIISQAPFIKKMVESLDRTETIENMQMRLGGEMFAHLGDGPFLGGSKSPTLVDFSLFPQLVFPYMAGLAHKITTDDIPALKTWRQNVAKHLPKNPILVPDEFIVSYLD